MKLYMIVLPIIFINWRRCSLRVRCIKYGFAVLICSNTGLRRWAYIGHLNKKCDSFSTALGQKGQKRLSFGNFLCRPVSIIKWWSESLSFVTIILLDLFLIMSKYLSNPMSVLNRPYVLNLLFSSRKVSNAFGEIHQIAAEREFCVWNGIHSRPFWYSQLAYPYSPRVI